jgi:FkbM family methyltransferase
MNLSLYTQIKIYLIYLLCFLFCIKNKNFFKFIIDKKKISKSQVFQDLFAYFFSNCKKRGVFIEIGGGNGVDLSNTYILEKMFKWTGVVCEPDNRLHTNILSKRKCFLETAPITNSSNKIFYFNDKGTYNSYTSSTYNSSAKKLKSLSLNNLIKKYQLTKNIDYISIDTEGNELDIIKNFNFNKYNVKIFTIEHNFQKNIRENIYKILKKNNYQRVFKYISYMDDWYIKRNYSKFN